jgi:hypothetical protein
LLSDPAFGEEFDTIVDEITDDYLNNELTSDERERVRRYFLSTPEGQRKLEFAAELLRHAESNRKGRKVVPEKDSRPTFFEQIAAFWRRPSLVPIATVMILVIVASLAFFQLRPSPPESYQALNLTISEADRAAGPSIQRTKLPPNTGLEITVTIPENARGAKDYFAQLGNGTELKIDKRTEQTVTVKVPPALAKPGPHAIQLFKVKSDNSRERIPGSYFFAVE